MKNSILIVDDEAAQRQLLSTVIGKDYIVQLANDGYEAKKILEQQSFDLIITDERMPNMNGIKLIKWVKDHIPEMPIIVLTAYGSIQTAVEAIKLGAQDYLTKPLKSPDELRLMVAKVLRNRLLRDQQIVNQDENDSRFPSNIVAESDSMKQVIRLAHQVSKLQTTVLLTGESGVGKEVVSRYIHRSSPRKDNQFVAVNCAALTETLLESELFGHEKGAFTGATNDKRGRFELAHGGTIFLDEIGEMSMELQTTLLRVLQEQEFERVGGIRTIKVDVRVIAATNRDLTKAIEAREFRGDLFYRINVFPIHIPPLRARLNDIGPLANYFAKVISSKIGQTEKSISSMAMEILHHYDWPGNIRELQNAIERALIVAQSNKIQPEDLPLQLSHNSPVEAKPTTLAEVEKTTIIETLLKNQGDRRKTCEELGVSLRTLQSRLKEYGIAGK